MEGSRANGGERQKEGRGSTQQAKHAGAVAAVQAVADAAASAIEMSKQVAGSEMCTERVEAAKKALDEAVATCSVLGHTSERANMKVEGALSLLSVGRGHAMVRAGWRMGLKGTKGTEGMGKRRAMRRMREASG